MVQVEAKEFKQESIGKIVSNSKERLMWTFEINTTHNIVTLTLSHLSKKYEIFLNGVSKKVGTEVFGKVCFEVTHLNCLINLTSDFKRSYLKINGTSFENLYWKNGINPNSITQRTQFISFKYKQLLYYKFILENIYGY